MENDTSEPTVVKCSFPFVQVSELLLEIDELVHAASPVLRWMAKQNAMPVDDLSGVAAGIGPTV